MGRGSNSGGQIVVDPLQPVLNNNQLRIKIMLRRGRERMDSRLLKSQEGDGEEVALYLSLGLLAGWLATD